MSSIRSIISKEASRVTTSELEYMSKVAGALGYAGVGLGGMGLGALANHYLSGPSDSEIKRLEEEANKRALMGAGVGALGALALRKPVQGLVAPDPEDTVYMDDAEFDDLWKQRRKSR